MKQIRNYVIMAIIITIICLLLSVVIFFTYHAFYSYQVRNASQVSRYLGDVNADFQITWEDVTAMQELYLPEGSVYTKQDIECADLNQDGMIDNEDTAILLYLANHESWSFKGLEAYRNTYYDHSQ
ncbi:MAG: hypothetical protein IJ642_09055 [Oscillospiraceae bacterium]|nr:hypothetical protein [Oscillospiraceae bacterium]